MSHRSNLLRIKAVFNALGPLQKKVVFIGGATVSLYVDRMAEEVRPTYDVDVVVEIWTYKDYAAVEDRLRKMGFENDKESGIICRYKIQGIIVDIMPTGEDVLFFKNKWYAAGYANAIDYSTPDGYCFKIFSLPYFIASKIDAFRDRGNNDGRTSTDFEDIVYVLENKISVWDDLERSPIDVRLFLKTEFADFLNDPFFEEWVDVHTDFGSKLAKDYIIGKLREFVGN